MSNESKFDEAKGRVKEATGALTNDKDLKDEGRVDQMAADAKDALGSVADKAAGLVDKARDTLNNDDDR